MDLVTCDHPQDKRETYEEIDENDWITVIEICTLCNEIIEIC